MEKVRDNYVEAERRIGQALFALGQGAGAIRISRDAVSAARERYLEHFARTIAREWAQGRDNWLAEGPNVLDRARAMGRLAAHLAICQGSMAIEARHLLAAAEQIHKYHTGFWCEPPPEAKLQATREEVLGTHREVGVH